MPRAFHPAVLLILFAMACAALTCASEQQYREPLIGVQATSYDLRVNCHPEETVHSCLDKLIAVSGYRFVLPVARDGGRQ